MTKFAKTAGRVNTVDTKMAAEAKAEREASKAAWKKSFMYDLVHSAWWFNALVGVIALLALLCNWVVVHYAG